MDNIQSKIIGHVKITDDLGNTLLDKQNAIHPRNLARIIARGLANESNSSIYRIAYGNGGTLTDASLNVTFNTPNDGVPPNDIDWRSRLYNETYSEVVDDVSSNLGIDEGSSDQSGTRTGGGSVPAGENGTGVISNDLGFTSEVVVTSIINANEPVNQVGIGVSQPANGAFVFDEIGLYSGGASATDTAAYVNIDVGNKGSEDSTNLTEGVTYSFSFSVDGNADVDVVFTPPVGSGTGPSGEILFGDLVEALNTGDSTWGLSTQLAGAALKISDNTTKWPTTTAAEKFGFLQLIGGTSGAGSSVTLSHGTVANTTDLIGALNGTILTAVQGSDAGVENNASAPSLEGERLLTHLIFQPIYKSAERQITVTYTLTVSVARTS